jgi:hypothetical protein
MRMAGLAARLPARRALTQCPTQADIAKLRHISQGTAKGRLACAALRYRAGKVFQSIRCNRAEPPAPKASPELAMPVGGASGQIRSPGRRPSIHPLFTFLRRTSRAFDPRVRQSDRLSPGRLGK